MAASPATGAVLVSSRAAIACAARAPFTERLLTIHTELRRLLAHHRPDSVAIENLFHASNVRSALKLFDFSHYYGAPSLLTRRATGRWLLYPPLTPNLLWEPLLRRIYTAPPEEDGPYYFFVCRKPAS